MLVLALNTAFTAMEAALVRDGEILADARETMARGQDRLLPDFVERLLATAGVTLAEVDRFAVVTGPGSFTGIRIGVAYARGLSLVTGAPCIGVTSLEAAIPAGMAGNTLGALLAQKRPPDQTWWVQGLEGDAGIAPPIEVTLGELKAMLDGFSVPVFIDGADALGEAGSGLDLRPMRPSAITAALKAPGFDPGAHPPSPVYARAPDATLPGTGA
ncbi:family M22 nonpeptidase-like protein [Hyphomonas johnsonii MHS-2]|uniref:Family M22 nonpeptidase-like protein n=2 Tax=Hyphomonas johnsonii TaxID=81031 RepID=A0A059FJH0_9PROT|nr:family M22 nonpeptidase-like protein [Hyphomonas johnsonii MHS-2]